MPFIRILIHTVWSTKNRNPLLLQPIRQRIFDHIKENGKKKGIFISAINGHIDHVHCLISLANDQSISKVIQLIKGESSFWINKNSLCKTKFEWQDEYFAVSVGESQVDAVRSYIDKQEDHHKKKSFGEEYEAFVAKYKFEKLG